LAQIFFFLSNVFTTTIIFFCLSLPLCLSVCCHNF
jgi:hypothetical protein